MPDQQFDRWVRRHVRRIRLGQFLRRAADFGAVFLCLFGAVVLFTKLAIPEFWPQVLWLAAGLVPLALVAWWIVAREPRSSAESVARLDRTLDAGGLLMMLSERPDAEWQERLPQLDQIWRDAIPRIRPKRFATNLALPLVFAIAACFVPLRDASQSLFARSTPAVNEAKKLDTLVDKLEETAVLEPEEREQIKKELAKLSEEARNKNFDSRKWEPLDAVAEKIREKIDAANNLVQQAQDAAEALSEEVDAHALKLSPEEQAQLSELLKKLQSSGDIDKLMKDAPEDLRASLQQLLKSAESKPGEEKSPDGKSKDGDQKGADKKSGDKGNEKGDKEGKGDKGDGQLTEQQQAALETLMKKMQENGNQDPGAREAAEKLAGAMQKSASKQAAGKQRQQTLQKNLGQSLQKLSKRGALNKASPELKSKLEKLMKRGESLEMPQNQEERQKLLNELKDFLDQENEKMAQLQSEGSSRSGSGQAQGEGEGDGDGEGDQDGKSSGKSKRIGSGRSSKGGRPGRGGIDRGRADAEMTFGDEAPKLQQRLKEVELPKGSETDPKDEVMSITKSAPLVKPLPEATRGESRNQDPSAGSVTVNHKLSPRHRGVVRRYFEDPKQKSAAPKAAPQKP